MVVDSCGRGYVSDIHLPPSCLEMILARCERNVYEHVELLLMSLMDLCRLNPTEVRSPTEELLWVSFLKPIPLKILFSRIHLTELQSCRCCPSFLSTLRPTCPFSVTNWVDCQVPFNHGWLHCMLATSIWLGTLRLNTLYDSYGHDGYLLRGCQFAGITST